MAKRIRGIGVNFRFGPAGYPEPVEDEVLVGDSIYTILSTMPGERRHRPQFGCNLKRLLFGNINQVTLVQVEVEARQAIERWEPRAIVDEILVRDEGSRIIVEVVWRLKGSLTDSRTQIPFSDAGVR
jgi:phage baseplate assembly protein W